MWCQVESQTGRGPGRFTSVPLLTDSVAADRLALDDVDPHDTTTLDGFASLNEDASHFTQDETVKDDEPVGKDDNIDVDKDDPLERTRAVLGNDDEELK